jgi:hypothetical protein
MRAYDFVARIPADLATKPLADAGIARAFSGIDRASSPASFKDMRDFTRRMYPGRVAVAATVLFAIGLAIAAPLAQSAITIAVDAAASRHPIDPNIYGVAHATTADLSDLNSPLNRNGGNNTTRYNWQQNADNRGNDWYFQSIADSSATPGARGDQFIASSHAAGAEPMLTIPLIDWVAKVGPNRSKLASFSIAKYGAQTGSDAQWMPDAGNGIRTSGQFVTGNDPNDANVPSTSLLQQQWAQHLVSQWGTRANGGLRYYILDKSRVSGTQRIATFNQPA